MAKMQELVDHPDILKEILTRVAKSSDGAKDFARAISVCKAFRRFVDDREVLRAVSFDHLAVNGHWELFWPVGGLICRCAQAGQEQAQFILGKIILGSTAQMVIAKRRARDQDKASSSATQAKDVNLPNEITQVSSFLESFLPGRTSPNLIGYHVDFVKIFLSRVGLREFEEMQPCLTLYMKHFIWRKGCDSEELMASIKKFVDFFKTACSFEDVLGPLIQVYSAMMRNGCLKFSRVLQRLGQKEEQLGGIEQELDDNAHTTAVEKLDMVIKRLSAAEAIREGFQEVSQHSSQKKSKVARKVLSELATFDFQTMKEKAEELRAQASYYQENRRDLLSKFHTFFL